MSDNAEPAIKTVDRALSLLDCFSQQEPELSIGELARRLGVHKSMVSRLVSTLKTRRLVEQDPVTRNVFIGGGALRLSSLYLQRIPLQAVAAPFVAELVNRTHHSAHLAVRDGLRFLIIHSVESPAAVRVILRTGEDRYLHATAGGKLFLAFSEQAYRDTLELVGMPSLTARTITTRAKLDAELGTVRRMGIAWNLEESHMGVGAVAAPVMDERGEVLGTVSVVFPVAGVNASARAALGNQVKASAAAISAAMVGKPQRRRSA
jgi:IclR family transcriptional regulator, KDG regulon repressor